MNDKKIKQKDIKLDLLNMEIAKDSDNHQNENGFHEIINEFSADDWLFLSELYLERKNYYTEQADLSSLDIQYPSHEIENEGLLIAFNEVLPYWPILQIDVNDVALKIKDMYCVRSDCNCNDIHLFISRYQRNKMLFPFMEEEREEMYIIYNIRENKWRLQEQAGLPIRSSIIMKTLSNEYETRELFKARYNLMKNLYKYYRLKNYASTIKKPGEEIGRNDPCPCGSGKKYKKCCMDIEL
ncbi:MAG: SEC-C metal-binding domain-containing protein [candidate division KSB1 bacterium]|nr:SEC-C metal-binding domain-containing protein [candidate division KSB1 bacterium]